MTSLRYVDNERDNRENQKFSRQQPWDFVGNSHSFLNAEAKRTILLSYVPLLRSISSNIGRIDREHLIL